MKPFVLSLALFVNQVLCAGGGGGGGSVLNNVLDIKNPEIAPTRFDKTVHLIDSDTATNTKPNDNSLDMRVWLKANDQNRLA